MKLIIDLQATVENNLEVEVKVTQINHHQHL